MPLDSHSFADDDVTLRKCSTDEVQLTFDFDPLSKPGDQYIFLNREDAIALAKHFQVRSQELK